MRSKYRHCHHQVPKADVANGLRLTFLLTSDADNLNSVFQGATSSSLNWHKGKKPIYCTRILKPGVLKLGSIDWPRRFNKLQ